MKYVLIGLLVYFLLSQLIFAQPIPVAILELEVAGIETTAKTGLTHRLRAELLGTGQFNVMERQRMESILTEQGFQQTGACSDDACLVEAGKILGVSKMIAGSVAKVGSLFEISIRMIDVGSGRILLEVTDATPGPLENVLTKSLRTVALKFAAQAAAPQHELHGLGSLKLRSNPPGARIFLDDRFLSQTTPAVIDSLPAGVHVVRLQKDLLAATQAVFIVPNETAEIDLQLSQLKGNLKIISEPAGVEIFLDHQSKGQSPAQFFYLPVGSYYLKLVKPGFVDFTQIVSLRENESRLVSAKLTPLSYLSIFTNPADCKIWADDSLAGLSPVRVLAVAPGYHRIKAGKDGFVELEQIHLVTAGQSDTLHLELRPAARLVVRSDPDEAEVWVNTLLKGRTPVTIGNLPPGPTLLKLKHPRCVDYLTEISLSAGETQTLAFSLTPRTSSLFVESVPADAVVEVDGLARGQTPFEVKHLPFGEHLVRVKKSGYATHEQRIEIQNEAPQSIQVKFEIARGTLFLYPRPNDAVIELNGDRLRSISTSGLQLFPGDYTIRAWRPGYENFNRQLSLEPGAGVSLNVDLAAKTTEKALLRSLLFPGLGQRYGEKQTRFRLFAGLEATALLGAVVSDIVLDNAIKTYHDRRQDYLEALSAENIETARDKMDESFQRAESTENWRNAFVISAAGIWLINILDATLLPPLRPKSRDFSLMLTPAPDQWEIGFTARF